MDSNDGNRVLDEIRAGLIPTIVCQFASTGNLPEMMATFKETTDALQLKAQAQTQAQANNSASATTHIHRTLSHSHSHGSYMSSGSGIGLDLHAGSTTPGAGTGTGTGVNSHDHHENGSSTPLLSPNVTDYDGRSGLHLAAANNHKHIISFLTSIGADVNIIDNFDRTPLIEAINSFPNYAKAAAAAACATDKELTSLQSPSSTFGGASASARGRASSTASTNSSNIGNINNLSVTVPMMSPASSNGNGNGDSVMLSPTFSEASSASADQSMNISVDYNAITSVSNTPTGTGKGAVAGTGTGKGKLLSQQSLPLTPVEVEALSSIELLIYYGAVLVQERGGITARGMIRQVHNDIRDEKLLIVKGWLIAGYNRLSTDIDGRCTYHIAAAATATATTNGDDNGDGDIATAMMKLLLFGDENWDEGLTVKDGDNQSDQGLHLDLPDLDLQFEVQLQKNTCSDTDSATASASASAEVDEKNLNMKTNFKFALNANPTAKAGLLMKDKMGHTPLDMAIRENNTTMIKLLTDCQSSIFYGDDGGDGGDSELDCVE
jgi:ankyrin repeat protein